MLRADDLNSQFANGANVINALTNVNEAHSADLARKKQHDLDLLRFYTKIGYDVGRERQMELLKKYGDDSIFGGIKELMGKYKTPNPIVANAGGEYLDAQVNALTGQSPETKVADVKAKAARGKALSDNQLKLNAPVEDVPKRNEPVKIVRGDVKSYLRKAVNDGTFVSEFKGPYGVMSSQNLNMYKPLVDLAVANGDWIAADMLNRQYLANKRSIDKSWGDEEGRGGVDSLLPRKEKSKGRGTPKVYKFQFYNRNAEPVGEPRGIAMYDDEITDIAGKGMQAFRRARVTDDYLYVTPTMIGSSDDVEVAQNAKAKHLWGMFSKDVENGIAKYDENGNIVYIKGKNAGRVINRAQFFGGKAEE